MYKLLALVLLAAGAGQAVFAKPLAIVTSGGINIFSNHGRYYKNLRSAANVLDPNWEIYNLAADGPGGKNPNSLNADEEDNFIYDRNGLPIPHRFEPESRFYGPATFAAISSALSAGLKQLQPGEPVLLYFTDHGSKGDGPSERKVCLWGEHLSVPQMRDLLRMVPESNKVIMINDQCYGGGMLEAMWLAGEPKKNACGFAAATTQQLAYGGGGFIRSIDKICSKAQENGRNCTFQDIYYRLAKKGMWQKNSTPISTSDIFLEKIIKRSRLTTPNGGLVLCGKKVKRAKPSAETTSQRALNRLLDTRYDMIRADLEADLSILDPRFLDGDEVCQNISEELITKTLARIEAEHLRLQQMNERLNGGIRPKFKTELVEGWLKEQGNPELYRSFYAKRYELKTLEQMKQNESVFSADLEAKLNETRHIFATLNDMVTLYITAIQDGDKEAPLVQSFSAYVQRKCKLGETAGCPVDNVVDQIEDIERKISHQTSNLTPAWKFYRDLTAARGLQILLESASQEELDQYSDLLDCEKTRIL